MPQRWIGEDVGHDAFGIALELALGPRDEGAIGNKPVERIAHERELEEARELLRREIGTHLLKRKMPMLNPGELGNRELALNERADLLHVLGPQVPAKRTANGMRSCLGNRDEDETVLQGYDHRPVKIGLRFSRKAATPSR